MEGMKKRLAERITRNGIYVHFSPPKVVPAMTPSRIRQWARGGDVERLELVVLEGQGHRLLGETSHEPKTGNFLRTVPQVMAKCEALHAAVTRGSLSELQELLQTLPSESSRSKYVMCRDAAGAGLLHKAVFYDFQDIAGWLVEKYPLAVHQRDSEGRTPLHYAAACRDPRAASALLEAAGAARGVRDAAGRTPAHYRTPALRLRLQLPEPSPPPPPTATQQTAADMPREQTRRNKTGVVIKPSNIRIWCHDCDLGRLQRVVWEGQGARLLTEVSSQPIVKKFLEAVPYIMNTIRDATAAVINNDLDALRSLTAHPVPPILLSSKDVNNMTILHKAAGLGNSDIVTYLVDRYPQGINDIDDFGRTPLHYAASFKVDRDAFDSLRGLGAEDGILDEKQKTAGYYLDRPNELDRTNLVVLPDAPRTASNVYPASWEWKFLESDVISELNKKTKRRPKKTTESLSTSEATNSVSNQFGGINTSSTLESIKDLLDVNDIKEAKKPFNKNMMNSKENPAGKRLRDTVPKSKDSQFIPLTELNGTHDTEDKEEVHEQDDENEETGDRHEEIEENDNQTEPDNVDVEQLEEYLENGTIVGEETSHIENTGDTSDANKDHELGSKKIDSNEPESNSININEPDLQDTDTNELEINDPKSNEPESNKPESDEPGSNEPESNEPGSNEPQSNEPESNEQESNKQESNEPEPNEPESYEPESNEPGTNEPESHEPGSNETENSANNKEGDNLSESGDEPDHEKPKDTLSSNIIPTEGVINDIVQSQNEDDDDVQVQGESESEYGDSNLRSTAEASDTASAKRGSASDGPNMQESLIEGLVNAEPEIDDMDASVEQRHESVKGDMFTVINDETDPEVTQLIGTSNMEMLAALVLNGEGGRLLGRRSQNQELQAFLDNVPAYMNKINRVHVAARAGNIRDLQAALDRRKFAIARDSISPSGATPLHVATLFGKTNIIKYLGGRFPETLSAVDFEGRTALHYAAVIPDNGHYYNLLQQLGANAKDLDDSGHSAEEYHEKGKYLTLNELMSDFGVDDAMGHEMLTDRGAEAAAGVAAASEGANGHVGIPIFKTDEGRYLANSLGDPLIKGLTEVATVKPKDPIAYLAGFLHNFPAQEQQARLGTQEEHLVVKQEAEAENEQPPPPLGAGEGGAGAGRTRDQPIDVIAIDPQAEPSPDAPEPASSSVNRDEHGQSMLHFASARTHARNAFFQLLQESDISVSYRDELYRTARDVSIQANIPENTADIDRFVVHLAARGNTDKIMELLMEGYENILSAVDEEGVPISEVVEQRGQTEVSRLLASITPFEESREALHAAIRRGDTDAVTTALEAEGGRTLARGKNTFGRTALHIAVLAQNEEIVAHLAKNCPELLRIGDNLERTPLHYAMGVDKMEALSRTLTRSGAKRVLKDLKGRQPSYYFMNKSDILRLKEEEEVY